jgi:uncharacterized protein (TIGR02118 family)
MTAPQATLVVLWTHPADAAAFEADYCGSHLALARQIPGLRELRVSMLRSPSHYRMAELCFESLDDLRAGLRSEEGRAVSQDAERLAQAHGVRSDSHVAVLDQVLPGRDDDLQRRQGASVDEL